MHCLHYFFSCALFNSLARYNLFQRRFQFNPKTILYQIFRFFLFFYYCRDDVLETNRGNHLLVHLLKTRFPNIFKPEQMKHIKNLLEKPLNTCKYNSEFKIFIKLVSYLSSFFFFPIQINQQHPMMRCVIPFFYHISQRIRNNIH